MGFARFVGYEGLLAVVHADRPMQGWQSTWTHGATHEKTTTQTLPVVKGSACHRSPENQDTWSRLEAKVSAIRLKLAMGPYRECKMMVMETTKLDTGKSISWSDSFVLGFQPMDTVHQELIDILGKLQKATDCELKMLLQSLLDHLDEHFEYENSLMISSEFPPRECHIDEHAAVMQSVIDVQNCLEQGDFEVCRRLTEALVNWFPSHADYLDSALAHWCERLLISA